MSADEPRHSDSFGLWLLVAMAVAAAMALFSASRAKPPVVFAAGLGLVLGVLLRILADWMSVPRTLRVFISVALLAAAAFAVSFGLGYRRAALEWTKLHDVGPGNPLAAALLKSFPNSDPRELVAAQQRFTFSDYLSRRVPQWPSPWPESLWGAEWIACVAFAACSVSLRPRRASDV